VVTVVTDRSHRGRERCTGPPTRNLCVPRTLSTTLTSRVAVPASGRDDHRLCACGSRSS
jgi:hypothetical protein